MTREIQFKSNFFRLFKEEMTLEKREKTLIGIGMIIKTVLEIPQKNFGSETKTYTC